MLFLHFYKPGTADLIDIYKWMENISSVKIDSDFIRSKIKSQFLGSSSRKKALSRQVEGWEQL